VTPATIREFQMASSLDRRGIHCSDKVIEDCEAGREVVILVVSFADPRKRSVSFQAMQNKKTGVIQVIGNK